MDKQTKIAIGGAVIVILTTLAIIHWRLLAALWWACVAILKQSR
jgi:hypothetical protein